MDVTSTLGNLVDLDYLKALEINRDLLGLAFFYTFALAPLIFLLGAFFLILVPTAWDDIPAPTGCRKVGLKGTSNLADEYVPAETDTESDSQKQNKGPFRVKSLWIYAIKSCRGIELDSSTITPTGLAYDRQFSLAQLVTPRASSPSPSSSHPDNKTAPQPEWRFITQREYPLLSQVTTELWLPSPTSPLYSPSLPYVLSGGAIILTFPDPCLGLSGSFRRKMHSLFNLPLSTKSAIIPFSPTPDQVKEKAYPTAKFRIWKDTPLAQDMGVHIPKELSHYLGLKNPLTLFRVSEPREVCRAAPRKAELGYQPTTGFADAYPLNILGVASVRALSGMQPEGSRELSARRFRANIVFEGAGAFEEDEWKRVRIGSRGVAGRDVRAVRKGDEKRREGYKYEYHVVCRCVRCKVPNVDLETGVRDRNQPYTTLVKKREIDPGAKGLGCLGMQMVPVEQEARVKVGDWIEVLERGEHEYIKQ